MEMLDLDKLTPKHATKLASILTGIPTKFFIKAYLGDAKYTKRPDGKAWFCQTLETGVEISTGDILEFELNRDIADKANRIGEYIDKHKLNKKVSIPANDNKLEM